MIALLLLSVGLIFGSIIIIKIKSQKRLYHFERSFFTQPLPTTQIDHYFLKLNDGTPIDTWYSKNNQSKKAILFLHGNSGRAPHMYHELSQLGSVLSPAYPQFHYSGGRVNQKNVYETAELGYTHLLELGFEEKDIIILGHSFGGAPAVYLASKKPNANKLIVINSFASVYSMCKKSFGPLCILCKTLYFSTSYAQNITVPSIVAHLENDNAIPTNQGLELFNSLGTAKKQYIALSSESHSFIDFHPLKKYFE